MSDPGVNCVLVHGWGLNRHVWDRVVATLGDERRVTALDLPGHGAAAPAADWVTALADAAPTPAVWVGWSLGGLMALRVAATRPEQVRGLVLVGSSPRFARGDDWPWGLPQAVLDDFGRRLESDYEGLMREFLALQVQGSRAGDAGVRGLLRYLRDVLSNAPPTPEGLRHGLDLLRGLDLRPALPDIAAPALWVAGNRDRLAHPEAARRAAALMPDAAPHVIDGAAHAPFLSHPGAFLAALRAFLSELPELVP